MRALIKQGWQVVTTDSRFWIIVFLLVIFPAFFVYLYTVEANIREANLASVLRQKVSVVHTAVAALIETQSAPEQFFKILADNQTDLRELQIVSENNGVFTVTYDALGGEVGRVITQTQPFIMSKMTPGVSYTFPYHSFGVNKEQSFRSIVLPDGSSAFIFSEHDFTDYYELFAVREMRLQFTLIIIYLFLILLAYWVARQKNFATLYAAEVAKRQEHDTFMNSMVHELRAPLTALRGYASLIEESPNIGETERTFATRTKDSAARLIVLINDLLEVARIQSGKLSVTLADLNLMELLDGVVESSLPLAKKQGLEIRTDWQGKSINIKSDSKRLSQVITNLISNAIKYTEKGTITVSVKESFGAVVIAVSDTGVGISAEDQKKLFAPFVRVGTATQSNTVTGSGLGMWVTKRLVEQLGGTVSLESIQGIGTHVRVALPKSGPK